MNTKRLSSLTALLLIMLVPITLVAWGQMQEAMYGYQASSSLANEPMGFSATGYPSAETREQYRRGTTKSKYSSSRDAKHSLNSNHSEQRRSRRDKNYAYKYGQEYKDPRGIRQSRNKHHKNQY